MLKNIRTLLNRFRRSQGGNSAFIVALSAPILMAGMGFATETSFWYFKQRKLQLATDGAAYAGGIDRRAGAALATVKSTALTMALKAGYDGAGTLSVNLPPLTGPNAGNTDSVEVLVDEQLPRYFTAFFTAAPVWMHSRAVARFKTASSACVLALSASASKAAYFSGASNLNLTGCSVMANSMASDAVSVQGSAKLATPCVYAAGGVVSTSGLSLTDSDCKQRGPQANQAPAADPFQALAAPTQPTGACKSTTGATLQPGRYCSGMDIKSNVTLKPGLYYLNGDFQVNANAKITGTGVTIFLAGGAKVNINGTATLDLQAPATDQKDGSVKGVLFMGDPAYNSTGTRHSFNGTANSKLTGAIYFKRQGVDYNGSFAGLNGCTQVVADTVSWTGAANVSVDCSAYGMSPIPATKVVQIVE
ncbi:MAG: pilus assembly protein TadG-related protein [Hyphomicrobiales bacterium]